jgi:DNA-binding PadR family transcriptional regulator
VLKEKNALAADLFSKYELNDSMQRNYLGEFEELILLTVAVMNGEGYGVSILKDIATRTNRSVQLSAVHVALYRLEEKGLVRSHLGGATKERGGRRKRFFTITPSGISLLQDIRHVREQLWSLMPKPI